MSDRVANEADGIVTLLALFLGELVYVKSECVFTLLVLLLSSLAPASLLDVDAWEVDVAGSAVTWEAEADSDSGEGLGITSTGAAIRVKYMPLLNPGTFDDHKTSTSAYQMN